MPRRYYSSTFTATTLTGSIDASVTAVAVAAVTGAPASVPWTGVIDRGTASEELVTVTNVSGTSLTVTRGVDGSTAKVHSAGAAFEHAISARDVDEPNDHINKTAGAHAATAISFAPAAGIASTTVQAAIEEVVSDSGAAYVKQAGGDTITASGAAVIPLVVKGAAAQTANLLEARSSAGTVLAGVGADGVLILNTAHTTTGAKTGGSAAALPAQPVQYLTLKLSDGSIRYIPMYS